MSENGKRNWSDPERQVPRNHTFPGLVEEAYKVFSTHKPDDVEVCIDHCMPSRIAEDFFNHEARDLPLHYVHEWYSAAAATEGVSKHLWTYMLPRILELLVSNQEPSVLGIEVALQRFPVGQANQWSDDQWRVLDKFQRLYLERTISSDLDTQGAYLDDVMCMFRRGGWNLDDLCSQLMAIPTEQLTNRLWRDWCEGFGEYGKIWITAFWEPEDAKRVQEFYTSDLLLERIFDLFQNEDTSTETALRAANIIDVIERSA